MTAFSQLPMPVGFTVGFMLLFSIVIALFKDIPDAQVYLPEASSKL
jgi:hypothetical protein